MSNINYTTNIQIYNSLSQSKEPFVPNNPKTVSMYTCGITVYHDTHIGHIKKYIGDDLIRRSLQFLGFGVNHVQNVTDVGHLTSDGDEGEDKLEKGARLKNVNVWDLAKTLTADFYNQMDAVNNLRPTIVEGAASDKAIQNQITMIKKMVDDGYGYVTDSAVYFNVAKLPNYNPFSKQSLDTKIKGARDDVVVDSQKNNPSDFALWVFTKGIHKNHVMRWESPWGTGFPGWHIECSAISTFNLGDKIDIHTGGVDHLEIHHPNEIAQNYAYYGHSVVKYWVHHKFLLVDGTKMSKSLGNYYVLQDLINKGYDPLVVRYFMLQAHYRSEINFTLKALDSSKSAFDKLINIVAKYLVDVDGIPAKIDKNNTYYKLFVEAISDDFNIPRALAVMWDLINDINVELPTKLSLVFDFDNVFGLKIEEKANFVYLQNKQGREQVPSEIKELAKKRWEAKQNKDFLNADTLRKQIEQSGYKIVDSSEGYTVEKL